MIVRNPDFGGLFMEECLKQGRGFSKPTSVINTKPPTCPSVIELPRIISSPKSRPSVWSTHHVSNFFFCAFLAENIYLHIFFLNFMVCAKSCFSCLIKKLIFKFFSWVVFGTTKVVSIAAADKIIRRKNDWQAREKERVVLFQLKYWKSKFKINIDFWIFIFCEKCPSLNVVLLILWRM